MTMRILVVTQYFWPENFRINELVAELVRRGNQVTVLTGRPNYPDGEVFPEFRQSPGIFTSYQGADIVRVPMWPRGRGTLSLVFNYLSFAFFASLVGTWKMRGRRFDVLFVFEPSPVTVGIPAIVLRRLKRAPLLFWVLDQWPETLSAVGAVKSPRMLRLVGRLVSYIYNRCEAVLAQSKSMVTLIGRYTRPPERVHYFPNWTEAMQDPREAQPAPELPAVHDTFDIMFAGNIGESQDFGAILTAAELLRAEPRVRWIIVGDGRMAAWVRAEIARRGLDANVLMLGRHAPERMPSFYRCADALLLALRDDPVFALTVPGKLQSYLVAGVPVLGMLNGDGARIIEEAGAGFTCDAGDSTGLANAVRRLLALSSDERAQMAERGRSYAKREFDRDRLVVTLEQHMHAVVQEHLRCGGALRTWGASS